MRRARYALPLLFAVAPALAHAQLVLDSVHVEVADGVYPSYVYSEVTIPDTLGPIPLVLVEGDGTTAPPSHGCDPLVNADEVADAIALVERGTCAFLTKVQRAVDAGAVAVVIALNGTADPDYIGPPVLCGDCPPWEAAGPLLLVSYNSGQAILAELASGPTDVTLVPVRVASPVAVEETTQAGAFVLPPVYPNPLASHATIGLNLPTAQAVRVAVFDVLGREVAVVHDGPLAAGRHDLALDASALPSGVYIVRVEAGSARLAQPLTVVR
ncbi:MAG: PA domain-containing protein [Rhodothermales bacterium]